MRGCVSVDLTGGRLGSLADSYRLMECTFNVKMSWGSHDATLCSRLGGLLDETQIFKNVVSTVALLTFYHASILSLMQYRMMFWGYSSYAARLSVLQKTIFKIIFGLKNHTSCRS